MSNTIYLYLKTHNQTGFKYLGKTTQDPFKYNGSGLHWVRHLKVHGNDVTTEFLFETTDKNEFKKVALEYSEKYNIVQSKEFANMRPETGDGGDNSRFVDYDKVSKTNTGRKMSEEAIRKSVESRRLGAGYSQRKGIKQSEEWREKRINTSKERGYDYNRDPEITKKKIETRMKNGSYSKSDEEKRKISEKMKLVWEERKRSKQMDV